MLKPLGCSGRDLGDQLKSKIVGETTLGETLFADSMKIFTSLIMDLSELPSIEDFEAFTRTL